MEVTISSQVLCIFYLYVRPLMMRFYKRIQVKILEKYEGEATCDILFSTFSHLFDSSQIDQKIDIDCSTQDTIIHRRLNREFSVYLSYIWSY